MSKDNAENLLYFLSYFMYYSGIAGWAYILVRKSQLKPILSYVPRRPVPWGPFGFFCVLLFVFAQVNALLMQSVAGDVTQSQDQSQYFSPSIMFWDGMIRLGLALFTQGWILFVSEGNREDLGYPLSVKSAVGDFAIASVAFVVATVVVSLILTYIQELFDFTPRHDLIEKLKEQDSWWFFAVSVFTAVIVAPIAEEIFFRQLAQGFLEKLEDARLGWRRPVLTIPKDGESSIEEVAESPEISENFNVELSSGATSTSKDSPSADAIPEEPEIPPKIGWGGLPYGWLPILISSALFALAHLGQGSAPIALFFLAIILGYIYQRTHRILPCIFLHMIFNGFTLLSLLLSNWPEQ